MRIRLFIVLISVVQNSDCRQELLRPMGGGLSECTSAGQPFNDRGFEWPFGTPNDVLYLTAALLAQS